MKQSTRQPIRKPESILLLGSQMETGGAQRVLLNQAGWFYERGYSVTVAFLYDKENLEDVWHRSYPFPIINLKARECSHRNVPFLKQIACLPGGMRRLWRLMKQERFDIIETFHHHCNLIGIPLAWLCGISVRIASHHGHLHGFSGWMRFLHTIVINSPMTTHYVVVSQALLEENQRLHIGTQKTIMIANGIQTIVPSDAEVAELRQSLALDAVQPVLLTAGRLTEVKGHSTMLQALPAVLGRFPKVVLLVAGDGSLRANLEAEAWQLHISHSVRFLGIRNDLPALMGLAQLFILPSLHEGLPLVMLEAMSAGLPVIASNVGGVPEVVRSNENGILVPPQDSAMLSVSIMELLGDEKRCAQLAQQARQLIEKEYSFGLMCQRYEALWRGEN